jgi:hypothetical protein
VEELRPLVPSDVAGRVLTLLLLPDEVVLSLLLLRPLLLAELLPELYRSLVAELLPLPYAELRPLYAELLPE